ncbi:MAG: pilin [bacterium]
MNSKKLKIFLYLPLIIFFIANFFYYPPPAKAAQTCSWTYLNWGAFNTRKSCNGTSAQYSVEAVGGDSDCAAQSKPPPSGLAPDPNGWGCCCKPDTPSPLNTTMPYIKIPDVNLQINIPGLNLTKGSAITCTEKAGIKTCNIPWISEYIAGIYKYAIGIVGILAAVVLMVGGVLWIIAGGSATMIGEAKSWIGASLTGLVIALCSYLILYQVNPALTVFQPLKVAQVKKETIIATGACKWATGANCFRTLGYGWEEGTECKEDKGENTLCCCLPCKPGIACEACNNCIPTSNSTIDCKETPCLINSDLTSKLLVVKNQDSSWRVTEGWPPTVTHLDDCHKKGTCVDINFINKTEDPDAVAKLYKIFVNAGLRAVYEHKDCIEYRRRGVNCNIYPTTTAPSFHVE